MDEFSLAISKVGVDSAAVVAPVYSVVVATAFTSFVAPYITRSADSVAHLFARRSPTLLKVYVARLADWLYAIRATFARGSKYSWRQPKHGSEVGS